MYFTSILLAYLWVVTLQPLVPPIDFLWGSRILLVPVLLTFVAMEFELPLVLLFAFVAGFVWDALTAQVLITESAMSVEIAFGWSILLFGILASLLNALHESSLRGRWEIHAIASGLSASLIALSEYVLISLMRSKSLHDLIPDPIVWWRILAQGLICTFAAPLLFFPLAWIARPLGYRFGESPRTL